MSTFITQQLHNNQCFNQCFDAINTLTFNRDLHLSLIPILIGLILYSICVLTRHNNIRNLYNSNLDRLIHMNELVNTLRCKQYSVMCQYFSLGDYQKAQFIYDNIIVHDHNELDQNTNYSDNKYTIFKFDHGTMLPCTEYEAMIWMFTKAISADNMTGLKWIIETLTSQVKDNANSALLTLIRHNPTKHSMIHYLCEELEDNIDFVLALEFYLKKLHLMYDESNDKHRDDILLLQYLCSMADQTRDEFNEMVEEEDINISNSLKAWFDRYYDDIDKSQILVNDSVSNDHVSAEQKDNVENTIVENSIVENTNDIDNCM